jgi:hypothetical protein
MSKSSSASYGHVKRKINAGLPLTGELLQLALDAVGGDDEECRRIREKLKAGEALDEYEHHLVCDVFLLHARLADASASRANR